MSHPTPSAQLSRRGFLGSTLLTAGAIGVPSLLTGCTAGGSGSVSTKSVTVMYASNEFTKAHIAQFEKRNPGMRIEFIEYDQTRLNAMLAAGNPPDFVRGAMEPNDILRGLVTPLDDYIDASTVIKRDDLLAINNGRRWDGKRIGKGKYYALVKDWSPDASLWQNTSLLEKAGVPPLSTTEPMSWDELLKVAEKLTVRRGGKTTQFGLGMEWAWGVKSPILLMVAQQSTDLYNADLTEIDFTSAAARRAMQWYTDFGRSGVGPTVLNPLPDNSDQSTFAAGKMAISMDGYWFGANFIKSDPALQEAVRMTPAPTFGKRLNSSFNGGMGAYIPAKAKNKDGAWKVMEFFMAGPPAVERAKSGWGLPSLESLWHHLPQKYEYQKQAMKTARAELEHLATTTSSPYISTPQLTAAVEGQMPDLLKGKTTVDQACERIQSQLNKQLKQGKEQLG
ncbi:extracellular solute-binding protein [Streptomyces sp. SID8379]|uniref:ABC transporter substrate-binding protein n=1 Tax=unclassified Streptomyces TaxID=2593676 RepID=UPI0003720024|nr:MULTISPECIES: sugar ABC transporter substrate-binding protein [unclassified Streptomyces]MYW70396.1 extracellular solute-binding protein [Streptomyces sp. SID8379]